MNRILGAVRLSALTDESTSPERQKAEISNDPAAAGGEISWAEDLDISAGEFSPFKRPELGPWLTQRPNAFDTLIFARADRAVRSMMDMHELSKWAAEHRKIVVFVKGPNGARMQLDFRNGPLDTMTQFMVMVFAFAAEMELNAIKERNRASQALARQEGRWHGGNPPYGYRPVKHPSGKGWVLEPDPETSAVVKSIVKMLVDDRKSLNAIAGILNENGVLTSVDWWRKVKGKKLKNARWEQTTLSRLLTSKTLLGYAEKDGEILFDEEGLPIQRAEPLISREEYAAIQKRLEEQRKTKARSDSTALLLHVAYCIRCGQPLYGNFTSNKVDGKYARPPYYRCRDKFAKPDGCPTPYMRADRLEELVSELVVAHLGPFEMREEVFQPGHSNAAELAEALEAHGDLIAKAAGKTGAIRGSYDRQIAAIERRIERLSTQPQAEEGVKYVSTGKTWSQLWEAADRQERRKTLLKAGIRIEAGTADGNWVSVGRFERPERYDEAVVAGVHEKLQYAFYVPKGLVERATRQPAKS